MHSVTPFLWFNNQAEEAVKLYTSVFKKSEIHEVSRYGEGGPMPAGTVMVMGFSVHGQKLLAMNGGPQFTFNPSVSFIVNFDPSKDEGARAYLDAAWTKLAEGGTVMMPLDKYPFSEHYGWVKDKYGVSWQLMLTNPAGEERPFITPALMFTGGVAGRAEEAIDLYCSVFPGGKRGVTARYPAGMPTEKEGTIMFADFNLLNTWFAAMDSGHEHGFTFNEAVSFVVNCDTQEEIDHYWTQLSAGGKQLDCGWLKDKFGVAWQIIPANLGKLMSDPARSKNVMQVLFTMKKLDIGKLEEAYNQ